MTPIRLSAALLHEARAARQRAAILQLGDPNVYLVDVGWRIRESAFRRIERGELRVRIHVHHKLRGAELESLRAERPQLEATDKEVGFPCDVIEIPNSYRLHAGYFPDFSVPWGSPRPATPAAAAARRFRPLQGGISAMWDGGTFATLGGIVVDRATGAPMILSNWHVLAGWAFAGAGQRILQPAPADGGRPSADTIAALDRDAMEQGIDAAVATLLPGVGFVTDQLGIDGPVAGSAPVELDMQVVKSGRTTGVTEGVVDGIDGERLMYYAGFARTIHHIAHIAPASSDNLSAGGDSGSWYLEKSSRRAVALHFAGSDYPDYALGISMPHVLGALDVDIAL